MIATLNKSKTALSINKQEFKAALSKIGDGIDKQIASLKKAKQTYDAAEMAREVINEANLAKTYELLNEKNKNTLWGKYFVDNGAVSTTAVFYSRDGEILPEDLLDILKLMRFSIEELHKDLLKELL